MATFFTSGERFKGPKEITPGPGEYNPGEVEGFKADPKSPFVGTERFVEGGKEGLVSGYNLDLPKPRNNVPPSVTDGGRQYSWATKRITELQQDVQKLQKVNENLRNSLARGHSEHELTVKRLEKLAKEHEQRECTITESRLKLEEELAERDLQQKGAREALEHAEKKLSAAEINLERLENELSTQWQNLQSQVQEATEQRRQAEEENAGLKAWCSRLAEEPVSSLSDAESVIGSTLSRLSSLTQGASLHQQAFQAKEAELAAAETAKDKFLRKLEKAEEIAQTLDDKKFLLEESLRLAKQEAADIELRLREELRIVEDTLREEREKYGVQVVDELSAKIADLESRLTVVLEQQISSESEVAKLALKVKESAEGHQAALSNLKMSTEEARGFQNQLKDSELLRQELQCNLKRAEEKLKKSERIAEELAAEKEERRIGDQITDDLKAQLSASEKNLKDALEDLKKVRGEAQATAAQEQDLQASLLASVSAKDDLARQLQIAETALSSRISAEKKLQEEIKDAREQCKMLGEKICKKDLELTSLAQLQVEHRELKRVADLQLMHGASQQELCYKLQQTVRQLQALLTEKEEERVNTAKDLEICRLELVDKSLETEGAVRRVHEAEYATQRANAAVDHLSAELEELQKQHCKQAEDITEELQDENLHLHELLRSVDVKYREAEEQVKGRSRQVEALQSQLMSMEEEASGLRFSNSETQRLTAENALLANQLRVLEINIQDLVKTTDLGHNNSKQKVQYHLRLKQELEELRHECMLLLRERFQLEQCVRFLAAKNFMPSYIGADYGGMARATVQKIPVQPSSLRKSHLFVTPTKRACLLRSGRGVVAATSNANTPTKAELVASINQTATLTAASLRDLADDVEHVADAAANPMRRLLSSRSLHSEMPSCSSGTASEEDDAITAGKALDEADAERRAVEKRILNRIVEICSPQKTGRTSKLMQNVHHFHFSPEGSENGSVPVSPRSNCKPPASSVKNRWK